MSRPHAYILAGGRSSRFGSDKAWAMLDDKPLILHVRDALAPFAQSISVVAEAPGRFEALGLRTIADETPHLGPLGGLLAALADAPENAMILVTACDLLAPRTDAVQTLLTAAMPDDDALAMRWQGRWRPFPGLYRQRLLPMVRERLSSEDRSMRALLDQHARAVKSNALDSAIDCNTPDALAEACRQWELERRSGRRGADDASNL